LLAKWLKIISISLIPRLIERIFNRFILCSRSSLISVPVSTAFPTGLDGQQFGSFEF